MERVKKGSGSYMKKVEAGKLMNATTAIKRFGRALSIFLFLPAACHLFSTQVRAEVPVKFTYQGNLRQSGFLVNGNRSMVFRIYDSSTSAVELWTSPAYAVSLSTGVFRVTLAPALADWQNGNLWLELEVEGNRMSPREELTSAPYSINSLMLSGKRYSTALAAPTAPGLGELWYDSSINVLKFWNGTMWIDTSGLSTLVNHAFTHAGAGVDPIVSLGTHTVTGSVTVSSSVSAGWLSGDGSGIYNLNASKITFGSLNGDRIGNVIVSSHIVDGSIQNQDLADGSITRTKLNQSGCVSGNTLQWDGTQWACAASAVSEVDPISIHNQTTPQAGATFYVSSGTVNDLNVNNSLTVQGTALLKGASGQQGLSVEATGNVGIGMTGAAARLDIKGVDTQNYSLAIATGTAHQVVVSTSGAVGIGVESPKAKLDVGGAEGSGQYIAVFSSGNKLAAWLRNK